MKRFSARVGRLAAFTLIELLAVITIILLLAGLILGIAGHAQNKAAMARAQSEIQALSAALENYKIDNGAYPRDPGTSSVTDTLDPRDASMTDPGGTTKPTYSDTTKFLYRSLCGGFYYNNGTLVLYDANAISNKVPRPTIYFPFKDNQLKPPGSSTGDPSNVTAIVDPYGLSYGYSTAYQADLDNNKNPPTRGFNPTFDLWSTAGFSQLQGKAFPSPITTTTASTLWIKNW